MQIQRTLKTPLYLLLTMGLTVVEVSAKKYAPAQRVEFADAAWGEAWPHAQIRDHKETIRRGEAPGKTPRGKTFKPLRKKKRPQKESSPGNPPHTSPLKLQLAF